MRRPIVAGFVAALTAVAAGVVACSTFGEDAVPTSPEGGDAFAGNDDAGLPAVDADAASLPDSPDVAVPSPCSSDAGHLLCDDFDRDNTPGLPPVWTFVEQLQGGSLVLDPAFSRSPPKALIARGSGALSQATLQADKAATLPFGATCAFDLRVVESGPASGRVRVMQLKLSRAPTDYAIVELKVQEGSRVLEHGGLVAVNGPPQIVPAVTFDPVGVGWHRISVSLKGTSYRVSVDGHTTSVTFAGGSNAPFTSYLLTIGLVALETSAPWQLAIDNVTCDAD